MWNDGSSGYFTVSGSGSILPFQTTANDTAIQSFPIFTPTEGTTAVEILSLPPTDMTPAPDPAPINTNTQPHRFVVVDGQVNSSAEPRSQSKRPTKRKAKDTERRVGKALVDTYSKRSAGLLKKGEELAELTGAYVVVFAARPESIGEGFHRLYISDDFKTADAALTERINQVTKELEAIALELAHSAGHVGVRRKKSRANPTGGSSHANPTGEPTRAEEDTRSRDVSSTQSSRSDTTPNNAASSATPATHSVPATAIAGMSDQLTPWISQSEITTVVHLLKTQRRSYSLDVLEKLVQSFPGVRAVYDGHAIPPLVRLLEDNDHHIVRCVVRILSKVTRHWGSCMSMLQAGILPLFIRLLSREMEEEVLTQLPDILAEAILICHPECKHYIRALSREDLQTLIGHLSLGRIEVRVAAAVTIQAIARFGISDIARTLEESSTSLILCRLLLDCRNLTEEEKVASAIQTIDVSPCSEAVSLLKTRILPRLVQLLEDHNRDVVIAACPILRQLFYPGNFFEDEEILPPLTRLLSHHDIDVFVEAAWTASGSVAHVESDPTLRRIFDSTIIQGLTRLIHHQDDQVVIKALRGLMEAEKHLFLDILFEMVSGGGIQQLICLLSSDNINIAAAALDFLGCYAAYGLEFCRAITRLFIHHDAIAALIRNITPSNPLLCKTMYTLCTFPEPQISAAIKEACAEQHFFHFLSSSDVMPLSIIYIFNSFKDDGFSVFKDAGVSQLLVPFARRVMDMSDSYHDFVMELLAKLIFASESFCEEFRAAGAESLIANYLAGITSEHDVEDRHGLRNKLTRCVELLQRDSEVIRSD